MTVTLHLGVVEVPYAQAPNPRQRRPKAGTTTTGDVATFLENKYHPMEVFFEEKAASVIAPLLEKSVAGAIENLLLGAPPSNDPFGSATSKIEDAFKQFIATREIETVGIAGVPTQAALMGVSHRFKKPYQRRPRRPSFIDTGLYLASFKAWFTT
jgi:hypothetical protein